MSNSTASSGTASFSELNLSPSITKALDDVGYEVPTPIQSQAIPQLLQGLDLLGHAPTGTGKTAAFALPLLSRIDVKNKAVQILTLTPTRELAIQVAEAFQRYASHIKGFHVLPIYGGQPYTGQIHQLKRGVHVVVGTPGRLMDHMRKGTLKLGGLQALVLDEADEMLRMGFIDEVEWILEQTPQDRQMALFSATMPKQIERIARRYLNDPQEISIKARTATAETIRQRYWQVSGVHKLDALTRILEVEQFDAILMFVRTKTATTELAERLEARGYAAAAMNGDMAQNHREQTVERLKKGSLDILVATDVAARGLDVERISHVINYDIPYDTEAYIHRIGRTGRAGRKGDAILFVAPRERRMLYAIEKATRQKIEQLVLPTTETVNNKRIADFKQKITDTLAAGELAFTQGLVEQYRQEHDVPAVEIAAALAKMSIGDKPMLLSEDANRPARRRDEAKSRSESGKPPRSQKRRDKPRPEVDKDKERYRIEVGHKHGVKPGNIVGAIANESGLDGEHIGHIEIDTDFSLVDLPVGMPRDIFMELKKVRVCGEAIKISHYKKEQHKKEPHKKEPHRKEPHRKEQPAGKGRSKPAGSPARKGKPATTSKVKGSGRSGGAETKKAKSKLSLSKKDSSKAGRDKGKKRRR
ncbi:MAG: DEAD/DEAH box helicase [Gammaproteobacteria bacterium]|nr:DEAD/DEAH box helicase [Gammaproteobacteria bacterium]